MEHIDEETQNLITKALIEIRIVEEKFKKIQENPALHGAENGLTAEQLEILKKLISMVGEINIAADEIMKKCS